MTDRKDYFTEWREKNRKRYNKYQRDYKRKQREKAKNAAQ